MRPAVSPRTRSCLCGLASLVALSACVASKRPEPLRDDDFERLERAGFPSLVVGVVEPEPGIGSPSGATQLERAGSEGRGDALADRAVGGAVALIEDLRATGYFREVDFARQLKLPPDLLATPDLENGRRGEPMGMGFSLLSAGLIPMVLTNHWQRSFDLQAPGSDSYEHVDVHYTQVIVFSWMAILLLPFSNWTLGWNVVPEDYNEAVRLPLLEHQHEIEALVPKRAPP
ncbi:MAG: hypothetical protein ACREBE_07385 [bacterium]